MEFPQIPLKLNCFYKVPVHNSWFQKRKTTAHLPKHFTINTKIKARRRFDRMSLTSRLSRLNFVFKVNNWQQEMWIPNSIGKVVNVQSCDGTTVILVVVGSNQSARWRVVLSPHPIYAQNISEITHPPDLWTSILVLMHFTNKLDVIHLASS